MRVFNILIVFFVLFSANAQQKMAPKGQQEDHVINEYDNYGLKIDDSEALKSGSVLSQYENMSKNDTLAVKFSAKVSDVCKVKGCWMKLELDATRETMVKFKDYGFFVPKEAIGKSVIVNGKAYVEEMSVEDQRHFAKDAGKSASEIAQIKDVKRVFAFEADGVLIKK